LVRGFIVGMSLSYFDRSATSLICEFVPHPTATRGGEQAQLPIAGSASLAQRVEHQRRVGRTEPLLRSHGLRP
jgi:hypothetical protein